MDVDTGGGEILYRLQPPEGSVAVEDWATNIPIAATRLAPLGVAVRQRIDGALPMEDKSVDAVLNRHGDLDLVEAERVLRPGGVLFSQQVAIGNEAEIEEAFGVHPTAFPHARRNVADLTSQVAAAGLAADLVAEAVSVTRYLDVGALVLQLRAVPWQVPGFSSNANMDTLWRIHCRIEQAGSFDVHSKRLLMEAHKPN